MYTVHVECTVYCVAHIADWKICLWKFIMLTCLQNELEVHVLHWLNELKTVAKKKIKQSQKTGNRKKMIIKCAFKSIEIINNLFTVYFILNYKSWPQTSGIFIMAKCAEKEVLRACERNWEKLCEKFIWPTKIG